MTTTLPSIQPIEQHIFIIRKQKVLLSFHLATLYGIETRTLIQAVKRNPSRFPSDFFFQLNQSEFEILKSQFVISRSGKHGGSRFLPYAFTEQGVAMLSSVLKSQRAVQVNISIMRAFVKLRQLIEHNEELAKKIADIEQRIGNHDEALQTLLEAFKKLLHPPAGPRERIGFKP